MWDSHTRSVCGFACAERNNSPAAEAQTVNCPERLGAGMEPERKAISTDVCWLRSSLALISYVARYGNLWDVMRMRLLDANAVANCLGRQSLRVQRCTHTHTHTTLGRNTHDIHSRLTGCRAPMTSSAAHAPHNDVPRAQNGRPPRPLRAARRRRAGRPPPPRPSPLPASESSDAPAAPAAAAVGEHAATASSSAMPPSREVQVAVLAAELSSRSLVSRSAGAHRNDSLRRKRLLRRCSAVRYSGMSIRRGTEAVAAPKVSTAPRRGAPAVGRQFRAAREPVDAAARPCSASPNQHLLTRPTLLKPRAAAKESAAAAADVRRQNGADKAPFITPSRSRDLKAAPCAAAGKDGPRLLPMTGCHAAAAAA
eukprot:362504-Chlamydomonas_euryale.AAC.8